jgi:hypothetical protein
VHELCLGVSQSKCQKVSTVTFGENVWGKQPGAVDLAATHTRFDERTPVDTVGILQTVPCSVRPEECLDQGDDSGEPKTGRGREDESRTIGGSRYASATRYRG